VTVIAVIFDFDDTLVPDSTSLLFQSYGIDPRRAWTVDVKELTDQGYDPPLAYLRLILDRVGVGRELGEMSNATLRQFGSTLDDKYFSGLPGLFDDLRELATNYRDVSVEFYVISGGLEEVISGSSIIQNYFTGYYGCQLGESEVTGLVTYVKRCITFTEKTRYVFEIHKGIDAADSRTQPHLVNQLVPKDQRRVPFDQMIYVGDGLTDIPCFSLIDGMGGTVFGVFQPGAESAKQAFQRFIQTDRVKSLHSPHYGDDADLGALLRAAVATAASKAMLRQAGAAKN
jgi:phosphoglycolate phosphatase-like HAD superfamily hydrolase